jgi:hypothetical protein
MQFSELIKVGLGVYINQVMYFMVLENLTARKQVICLWDNYCAGGGGWSIQECGSPIRNNMFIFFVLISYNKNSNS